MREHIKLQFDRLKRHYEACSKTRDKVSMMDLSHSLRIWVEMKEDVDTLVASLDKNIEFKNKVMEGKIKNILKGSSYTWSPLLADESATSDLQVSQVFISDRAFSAEEVKTMHEEMMAQDQYKGMTFSNWLGASVMQTTGKKGTITISRETLIKRVANMLGASHPIHNEPSSNEIDPYILDLHSVEVADGYPLTYYQLIEIANQINITLGKHIGY